LTIPPTYHSSAIAFELTTAAWPLAGSLWGGLPGGLVGRGWASRLLASDSSRYRSSFLGGADASQPSTDGADMDAEIVGYVSPSRWP